MSSLLRVELFMKCIKYMSGTTTMVKVDELNSRVKKPKKTYEICLLIKRFLQNIEKKDRQVRVCMAKNNWHLFWMHMKPPQKLKTLDFIDFFRVASKLAVQHNEKDTNRCPFCFGCGNEVVKNGQSRTPVPTSLILSLQIIRLYDIIKSSK